MAVSDCPGVLPRDDEPWALVIQTNAEQVAVGGLPASQLRPGPRGCLVWRNTAATDAYLLAAFDKLWMYENCWV